MQKEKMMANNGSKRYVIIRSNSAGCFAGELATFGFQCARNEYQRGTAQ